MFKKGENILIDYQDKSYYCPVELAMDIIGGKWRAVILWYLMENTLRFHELKKKISTISERVLTRELRALEKYQLIERHTYAEVPPRVEYSLSEYGKTIIPLINQISHFGEGFGNQFGKNRKVKAQQ